MREKKEKEEEETRAWPPGHSRLAAGHALFRHDHALNLSEPWTSPKARVNITHLQNWTVESVGVTCSMAATFHEFPPE